MLKLASLFGSHSAPAPPPTFVPPSGPFGVVPFDSTILVGTSCCAYDALNRVIARGTRFGSVFVYGSCFVVELELQGRGCVTSLLFVSKHKLLIVFERKLVEVFNLVTGTSMCVREFPELILSMACPTNRNYVFCGTNSGKGLLSPLFLSLKLIGHGFKVLVLNLEQDVFVSTYAVLPESFDVKRDALGFDFLL